MIIDLFNNIQFLEFGAVFFALITIICNFCSIGINVKRKNNNDKMLIENSNNHANSTVYIRRKNWKCHIHHNQGVKIGNSKKVDKEIKTLIMEMYKENVPLEKIRIIANNSGITDETLNFILTKSYNKEL